MRHRLSFAFLGILGLTVALIGCRGGDDKKVPPSGKGGAQGDKPLVAFVSNNAHQFWTFAERGAEKAAAEFDVRLSFRKPSDGTAQVQRENIEDLLNQGAKGIAVSPNDSKNALSFFKDTVASKVALVMTDNDLPDPSARKCYIGTHNYRAGRAAGELVKKAIPKGGKIAIFAGQADSTNVVERRQGVLDALMGIDAKELSKTTPMGAADLDLGNGYILIATKIDGTKQQVCQEQAEDLLNSRPDVECFVGLWEYNPPALLRAVRNSTNKKKPAIVAFDENDQTLSGIKKDEVVGTIVQDPYQFGYQSIKVLAALIKGNDDVLKSWPGIEAGNSIFVPHRVITKNNVDAFEAEVRKILGK